jgi:hypothetical protein
MISGLGYTSAIASLNSAANASFLIATKLGLNLFTYSNIQHTYRCKTVSLQVAEQKDDHTKEEEYAKTHRP